MNMDRCINAYPSLPDRILYGERIHNTDAFFRPRKPGILIVGIPNRQQETVERIMHQI
jgi:hypothetical protein